MAVRVVDSHADVPHTRLEEEPPPSTFDDVVRRISEALVVQARRPPHASDVPQSDWE